MYSIDLRIADLAIFPPESTNRLWVTVCDQFIGSLRNKAVASPSDEAQTHTKNDIT